MSGVGRTWQPIEAGPPQLPQAPDSDKYPHCPEGSSIMDSPIPVRRTGTLYSRLGIFRPLLAWRPILIQERYGGVKA